LLHAVRLANSSYFFRFPSHFGPGFMNFAFDTIVFALASSFVIVGRPT
jgi:hypothetical protein